MSQQDFLQECGGSYLDVLAAMGYFREVVWKHCQLVAEKHLPILAELLRVPVGDLKRSRHNVPDNPSSGAISFAELGWKAKRQENLYLYFYIGWNREFDRNDEADSPMKVEFLVWLKDEEKSKSLAAKLDDLDQEPLFDGQPWWHETGSLHFWLNLRNDELPSFAEKLDQLLGFVIPYLTRVNGIEEYLMLADVYSSSTDQLWRADITYFGCARSLYLWL
jgi:hypothetical protein